MSRTEISEYKHPAEAIFIMYVLGDIYEIFRICEECHNRLIVKIWVIRLMGPGVMGL